MTENLPDLWQIGLLNPNENPSAAKALADALSEPFPPAEIQWKPVAFPKGRKDRALVVPFYDARLVYERLDQVVGPGNWQIRHQALALGVYTEIGIYIAGTWVWKGDIGMVDRSDETESATKTKGDATDGAKRAGAVWGIGRCYWLIPKDDDYWVDYDQERRQILQVPPIPKFALPYEMQKDLEDGESTKKRPVTTAKLGKHKPAKRETPKGRPLPPAEVQARFDAYYKRLKQEGKAPKASRAARSALQAMIESAFPEQDKTDGRAAVLGFLLAEDTTLNLDDPQVAAVAKYLDAAPGPDGEVVLPPWVVAELLAIFQTHEESL